MSNRISYFDQMKGVAIILVVVGHIMQFAFGYSQSDVVRMLGIFHMPIFFYISGYFLYKEEPDVTGMLCKLYKRVLNLLIPYLVFGMLWCQFTGTSFIALLTSGGGSYWFLWVLFLLSTFFIIYGYSLRKIKNEWLYLLLWLVPYGVIIVAKVFENRIGGGDFLSCNQLNTYYRYFLIGYLCHRYSKMNTFLFKNDIVYAIAFLLYFIQWRYCNLFNMVLIFCGGMGAIIVLQRYLSNKQNVHNAIMRFLTWIGGASLPVYVIHYFFIPDISDYSHLYLDAQNPFIWHLTFSLLLSLPIIVACIFVGQLIQQNKYLNFLFFGKTR